MLGHEIGHVLHRHSQSRLAQRKLGSLFLHALLRGDSDADGRVEGLGRELGGMMLQYASHLGSLSYSRAQELEADHIGTRQHFFLFLCVIALPLQVEALQNYFKKNSPFFFFFFK